MIRRLSIGLFALCAMVATAAWVASIGRVPLSVWTGDKTDFWEFTLSFSKLFIQRHHRVSAADAEPRVRVLLWEFHLIWGDIEAGRRWDSLCLPLPAVCAGLAAYPGFVVVRGLVRRRRYKPGTCARCGYNLTGNTSGVCPECGSAVPEQAVPIPPAGKTKDGL